MKILSWIFYKEDKIPELVYSRLDEKTCGFTFGHLNYAQFLTDDMGVIKNYTTFGAQVRAFP